MTRCAIIGAGLAGLTAAYELRKALPKAQIDVWEGSGRIGGKLHTVPFSAARVDMGAEAFLARRSDAREFFESLDLADELVYPSGRKPALYSDNAMRTLPTSGVMGIPSNSAPVADVVDAETAQRIDAEGSRESLEWTLGGDRSVGEVVRERYGDQVADRCVSALLGGVYSCAADDLGIRATIPALAEALDELVEAGQPVTLSAAVAKVEQARTAQAQASKELKPAPVFATFRKGYASLYERLAERSQADIFLETFVTSVAESADASGQYVLDGVGVDKHAYDAVILATPAPMAARLLTGLSRNSASSRQSALSEAASALGTIELASSAVVGMRFATDTDPAGVSLPDNSGILVAADQPGLTAKAFTLSSRKWPHLANQGVLVRASFGRFGNDEITRASEDDLVDAALDDLATITGFDGRGAGVEEIYTQRWFGGLPRYDKNHLATVERTRSALHQVSGIEAIGAWAGGVGVPAVIADARASVHRILGSLSGD